MNHMGMILEVFEYLHLAVPIDVERLCDEECRKRFGGLFRLTK